MLLQNLRLKNAAKQYSVLLLGAAIMSFGLYNIHSQSNITEGGILGMTLFLNHWLDISPGITGIWMDIACYFFAYKLLGKTFLKNAIIGSFGFSMFYNIYEYFGYAIPSLDGYPLFASISGGLVVGIGVGLIIYTGGASGGDDALAIIISKFFKCRISASYLFADLTVLALSLSYIPASKIFYSIISVSVSSVVVGKIHDLKKEKKSKY